MAAYSLTHGDLPVSRAVATPNRKRRQCPAPNHPRRVGCRERWLAHEHLQCNTTAFGKRADLLQFLVRQRTYNRVFDPGVSAADKDRSAAFTGSMQTTSGRQQQVGAAIGILAATELKLHWMTIAQDLHKRSHCILHTVLLPCPGLSIGTLVLFDDLEEISGQHGVLLARRSFPQTSSQSNHWRSEHGRCRDPHDTGHIAQCDQRMPLLLSGATTSASSRLLHDSWSCRGWLAGHPMTKRNRSFSWRVLSELP